MGKKIILKSLHLVNFKQFKEKELTFSDKLTIISGANRVGKTTIFDSFTWCLFGKNAADQTASGKNAFQIKTNGPDGEPIPKIEHSVEAVLDVNGIEYVFKRELREKWGNVKGREEQTLISDETKCSVNGIDVKVSVYQQRVNEIVDNELFKMLTSITYFANLDWQKQREILLSMCGGITLADVAKGNALFEKTLQILGERDLDLFKKSLVRQTNIIQNDLDDIDTSIKAVQKVTPEEPKGDLEKQKADLEKMIADIDEQLNNESKKQSVRFSKITNIQNQINALKANKQKAEFDAQSTLREAKNKLNELVREKERLVKNNKSNVENMDKDIKRANENISDKNKEIISLREEWNKINIEEYTKNTSDLICPLFNVACHDAFALTKTKESQKEAEKLFYENKAKKLDDINKKGQEISLEIEKLKASINSLNEQKTESGATYDDSLAVICSKINEATKVIEKNNVDIKTPQVIAIEAQIKDLEKSIDNIPTQEDNVELKQEKADLNVKLDVVKAQLNIKKTIFNNNQEIKNYNKRAEELLKQKADLEKQVFELDKLHHAQMDMLEEKVNKMFSFVQFKMFEKQKNEGETATCQIYHDGVRYNGGLNNEGRVNAGLDIINTLAKYNEVYAPIFLDEAGSVNDDKLLKTDSQLIKLVVSNEQELTINKF